MAITYPLTMPTSDIRSIQWEAGDNVAISASPFTNYEQTHRHPGHDLSAVVTLPPLKQDDAEEWIAFLLSLRGQEGSFFMGDPLNTSARGSAGGTPLVNGADQVGDELTIDGAAVSQTGWLKAGDYINIGSVTDGAWHRVLVDVDTDSSGGATLDLWPSINIAPADNAAIITSNTKGIFRLAVNKATWSVSEASIYGLSFPVKQVGEG